MEGINNFDRIILSWEILNSNIRVVAQFHKFHFKYFIDLNQKDWTTDNAYTYPLQL